MFSVFNFKNHLWIKGEVVQNNIFLPFLIDHTGQQNPFGKIGGILQSLLKNPQMDQGSLKRDLAVRVHMQNLWDPFCSPCQWEGGVHSNTSWKSWAELQCLAQSQKDQTATHFSVKWNSSPSISQNCLVTKCLLARY